MDALNDRVMIGVPVVIEPAHASIDAASALAGARAMVAENAAIDAPTCFPTAPCVPPAHESIDAVNDCDTGPPDGGGCSSSRRLIY
jgi:hypothetical protein